MLWRYLLVFIGVFASATAVIMIRMSHTHPTALSALRLLIASSLLIPVYWKEWRKHRETYTREHLRRTLLPAVLLAAHFITWGFGSRMTLASTGTLIVNLVPVVLPFILHSLVGERINRAEILGTALALFGVATLTARDAFIGGDFQGNLVCFVSMLAASGYVALGRRNRDFPSLWLYVIPIYLQAGVICLVASLPWLGTFDASRREWLLMLGLAAVPTILGHTIINYGMRHLRGQIVSLCNVSQFVFASILAWFVFHESPTLLFYGASALVVAGIALVVFSAPTAQPAAVE